MRALAIVLFASAACGQWLEPLPAGVSTVREGATWKIVHSRGGEFSLLAAGSRPAKPGDTFEVAVRIRADIHTVALPELACFDAAGRELPSRSSLADFTSTTTTRWQDYRRTFLAQPGTAAVRARVRGSGEGELWVEALELRPATVDTYRTGALYTAIHPRMRRGLVLESNLGVVNRDLVSPDDRDGDGRWAEILVDLDELSRMDQAGEDWRTKFEYKPNEIYWSDGAVLKSDTALASREPEAARALHFRMKAHRGPYRAIVNDPGTAVAVSTDGKNWRRFERGAEIEVGVLPAADGYIELWMDACYRDSLAPGPVYFDYVRLFPVVDEASEARLFAAARRAAPTTPASGTERRVRVTFDAPRFAGAAYWPVRASIPVPQGELAEASHATVRDATGRALATQNRAAASWSDGSVKWLYLDFAADLRASGRGGYEVAYGGPVRALPPPARMSLRRGEDGIDVDTGALRFRIPARRFGILERDGAGPLALEIAEEPGKVWRALDLPAARLEIEHEGPLHAVIRVETALAPPGRPAEGFYHRARIHAYAGSPLVDIDLFSANTDARKQVRVRAISLKLAARTGGSGASIAVDEKSAAPGYVSAGNIAVGVEAFREQHPKALRWSPSELSVDLWAPEGGVYEWIQGVGKTHRIALFFAPAAGGAGLLAHGPVLALADPEWHAASGVFGPIATAARSPLPQVEKTLAAQMDAGVVGRVGLGFENYGDHSSSGYVKGTYLWDNNEYDLPAGAIVHFVRTGDRAALRIGLASAQHYVDVDTIHYSSGHAGWAGAAHTHSHGTVGHHTAEGPNMHHAGYVQGLIWQSWITGEPAGLDGARGIADWALRNLAPELNTGGMERALGHPLATLNDVYEATWDEKYLRGAARLVDWAMKWEHPERGGFLAPITEQPAFYSGSPFCGGLITAALLKFNSWARLPEIDALLERTARWVLTDMWRPPGAIMSKGGSPRRTADPQNISTHLRSIRYVYAATQDPLFAAVPREAVLLGFGENAKSIGTRSTGLVFNYLPWYLPVLSDGLAPEPELRIEAEEELALRPGEPVRACAVVRNAGATAVRALRIGFQPRPDFKAELEAAPAELAPDGASRVCARLTPPARINSTSAHNRISYAHWTASYTRAGERRTAHRWVRATLP